MPPITAADIRAARDRIADAVRVTPVWPSVSLGGIAGDSVALKAEQLQRTGSFKIRGATNFVRQLTPAELQRGLVAASAGNHAQGVALAGSTAGASVVVVMPASAPLAKVAAAEAFGARVVLEGASLAEARHRAEEIAAAEGRIYVPPFDHRAIVAGQGTLGLELLEQVPALQEVLVPAGGGGLLAGVAMAIKDAAAHVRVVGVQAAAMPGISASVEAGRVLEVPVARTIADGVAVSAPSELTFGIIQRHVDDVVTVSEEAVSRAIVFLLERSKFVVEGAGALGVAAVHSGGYRPRGKTAIVLSGGNLDVNLLGAIVRRGLVEAGRYRHLAIEVSDTPGELALISGAIGRAGGNILEVHHTRDALDLPLGIALLDVLIEINGEEHHQRILTALAEHGIRDSGDVPGRIATATARRYHPE